MRQSEIFAALQNRALAAEGPDPELDGMIALALGWTRAPFEEAYRWQRADGSPWSGPPPRWSASIDEALEAVQAFLPGYDWRSGLVDDAAWRFNALGVWLNWGAGATPALCVLGCLFRDLRRRATVRELEAADG